MLVTVVRSKSGGVVELPGGVNIRPHNFVELKKLDEAMKNALGVLQKAGTVDVAQVADVSEVMMAGSIENRMPSDVTGAAAAMFQTDGERQASIERVKDMPDLLTDYSKFHALSADELSDHKAEVEEKVKRGESTGNGMLTSRVETVTRDELRDEQANIKRPSAPPTTVDAAVEKVGDAVVKEVAEAVAVVQGESKAPAQVSAPVKAPSHSAAAPTTPTTPTPAAKTAPTKA